MDWMNCGFGQPSAQPVKSARGMKSVHWDAARGSDQRRYRALWEIKDPVFSVLDSYEAKLGFRFFEFELFPSVSCKSLTFAEVRLKLKSGIVLFPLS